MKILVIGGAGYIGAHTCKALHRAGHEVVVFDNLSAGHRSFVRWSPLLQGDVNELRAISEAMQGEHPDAVIHFAALAYVGESMSQPEPYYRTNVAGTLNVLQAMREASVERIVFSSSCATYGVPVKLPITEATPQQPINPYGRSKLMVEHMLADYAQAYGIGSVSLRYFNAAGADPDGEIGEIHDPETHLIPLVLQAAMGERNSVAIFGDDYPTPDGTCVRDYIHVQDLADAHVRAVERCTPAIAECFNLGNEQGYSVRQVVDRCGAVTGRDIPVQICGRRPGDPPILIADASRAREILGWTPAFSDLDQIIGSAWAFANRK